MSKVDLLGLAKDKERILQAFQNTGYLEIVDMELPEGMVDEEWYSSLSFQTGNETIERLEREISEIEFALRFLDERVAADQEKKLLVRAEDLDAVWADKEEILSIAQTCRDFDAEENEIDSRRHRLRNEVNKYMPWLGLNLSLEDLEDTANVKVRAGSVPKNMAAEFMAAVEQYEMVVLKELGEEGEDAYFFIVFHKTLREEAREAAKRFDFTQANFGEDKGTPEEIIAGLEKKIEGLFIQKNLLQDRAEELAGKRASLMMLLDVMYMRLQREKAANQSVASAKTFTLKGWVKNSDREMLEDVIKGTTEFYKLTYSAPEDDEPFPVYTENALPVTPFEMVTNLYSVPASNGIDPNNVVAPFHALFLGLMMGDVGYGIVLALGGFFFRKKAKGGAKKLGGVIMYGGISSIVWGVLLGSYFGDIGTRLGIKALMLNPMEDPVNMLGLCLGLGFIHILVGMGVKAYMLIKEKKYLDAVFDIGFWYMLLIGLLLIAFFPWGKYLALVGAAGLLLTAGREKKNIFGKIMGGLGSLYGITGYLSDILSYSRLFALLLSSAVVAMVFNQIAAMVGTSVIGYVFAAIIFVIGHAFNLFIGGLGAFVHGSRLIYVEFFSKFYMGGGHAFDPLQKITKYISLENEEAK
jgi:V/A-type H+-transporting ATPase subunit I